MANVIHQKDLVISLKQETLLIVRTLSKLYPMPNELARLLKDNSFEKPTQNLFNHLAHYLVSLIDPNVSLPWPLYDTKTERTYRNELSVYISDCSSKGLLSPVMSSYLVNPGCYKVTVLMFEMSLLAVQRVVLQKMDNDQKNLYETMTEKYKSLRDDVFLTSIEKETEIKLSKFSNHLAKKEITKTIAKMLRDKIIDLENKVTKLKATELINNLVDGFIEKHSLDEENKNEILEIKDIHKPATFFDKWLAELDRDIDEMESNWEMKTGPLLKIAQTTYQNTETLIERQTGKADVKTFMIEFNPKTDNINTEYLEKEMNMQQKYILKNIVRDDRLSFPNLIRAFLISISYILTNMEIGNEIFQFNQFLLEARNNYEKIVNSMRILLERVMNARGMLQQRCETRRCSISIRDVTDIPPLPDLSDLKMNREFHPQMMFEAFTPLNFTKHQFNLRKHKSGSYLQPMPKVFATPFHHRMPNKEDFFKSLISCRVSAYDNMNVTQNTTIHNMSIISQGTNRANETIGELTSGFTKQQITRLLSTKKKSSSKRIAKHRIHRPDIKIVKGNLFNDSIISNENIKLVRSHSSPNLIENRDGRSRTSFRSRKLSVMKEDSPSLLEVSGIRALERESRHSTPQGMISLETSGKLIDAASIPSIIATPGSDMSTISNVEVDINKEIEFKKPQIILPQRKSKEMIEEQTSIPQRKSTERIKEENKVVTPKMNGQMPQVTKKTSSLEKIINRFKKVRASVLPSEPREDNTDFRTIFEEKENFNTVNVDVFTANRNLLPDLLSPSCSIITSKSTDFLEPLYFDCEDEKPRRPRESLGTALGVDHTFLDQFDLIDD